MKKRLVFTNALLVLGSLILLFFFSLVVIINDNNKNTTADLNTYLKISQNIFNGSNYQETSAGIREYNKNLRVTIIDLEGNVLYDSNYDNELESHIDRPELDNLGKVFSRYSNTLKKQMFYIATMDNGYYLRLALPSESINDVISKYVIISVTALIVILLISILFSHSILKKNLAPLNRVVNRLGKIVNSENLYGVDNVEVISKQIDLINEAIGNKINELNREKLKIEYIINNMQSGLIVLDDNKNIILINDYACDILNFQKAKIMNKSYLYIIRDPDLQANIEGAFTENKIKNIELSLDGKLYKIRFNRFNIGLMLTFIDISEAKTIEKMKKEFFANASHELKSPLTSIIGYQQMIKEGIIDDKAGISDAINVTIKEAERMNKIILEMLELSKLEGEVVPKFETVDLSLIVSDVLTSFKNEIEAKNITVTINTQKLIVKMNSLNAVTLVRNLIENAIKYNKQNGKLAITIYDNKFIIKDSGIGIAVEEQSRVFERFYRVDKGKSKQLGGTGLGLAIVKHICNLYKFTIDLQSVKNIGTTITIYFS